MPEVIDVWFDSGSMPFAQWHAPFENQDKFDEQFPADYICEAIDQTRGWFYSLIAISTLLFDQQLVQDRASASATSPIPQGKKMSKSLGNIVVPWDVIDRHGADAFRWYFLTNKRRGTATSSTPTPSASRCASSCCSSGTRTAST